MKMNLLDSGSRKINLKTNKMMKRNMITLNMTQRRNMGKFMQWRVELVM
jgi:hypothetical protein